MSLMLEQPAIPLVSSREVRSAIKKRLVFVEILPREISDVVSKPFEYVSMGRCEVDDPIGYQSIDDAIISAKHVGLCLMSKVEAKNLFFVFGETVHSLQCAFVEFCGMRSIPYNVADIYAPIDGEETDDGNQRNADPVAIVLCKVSDAKPISDYVRGGENDDTEDCDRYQVSWSELQGFDDILKSRHGVDLKTNDQNQPVCGADLFSESTAHANSAAFFC